MRVTKRARQSRRGMKARIGLPLIMGAVALGLSGAVQQAMAQAEYDIEKLMREVQAITPKEEPCPAELEIYHFKASTTELSWEDGEERQWAANPLAIAVGVTNNGGTPAAFDYALGDCRTHEVWVTAKGVNLAPGDKHVGGLRVTHEGLTYALDTAFLEAAGGIGTKTCVGIFLLQSGTKTLFRDGVVPNHDEQYSVAVDYIIQ